MRISQLANNLWKYLSVLAVLVATLIGVLIGDNLYAISLPSQPKTPALLRSEANGAQPLLAPRAVSSCDLSLLFTSLPPKCKTSDGSFMQANGAAPFVIMVPGAK
jgi:hypothetical protein